MRTKTRTTAAIKPGMVIRFGFSTKSFKQVSTVKPGPWPNTRYIAFTDGTGDWFHLNTDWTVARGKTTRKMVQAHTSLTPTLADALTLIAGYARTAVA